MCRCVDVSMCQVFYVFIFLTKGKLKITHFFLKEEMYYFCVLLKYLKIFIVLIGLVVSCQIINTTYLKRRKVLSKM